MTVAVLKTISIPLILPFMPYPFQGAKKKKNPDDLKESMRLAPFEAASAQETDCFTYFQVSHQILDSRCWKYEPGLKWRWEKQRSFV